MSTERNLVKKTINREGKPNTQETLIGHYDQSTSDVEECSPSVLLVMNKTNLYEVWGESNKDKSHAITYQQKIHSNPFLMDSLTYIVNKRYKKRQEENSIKHGRAQDPKVQIMSSSKFLWIILYMYELLFCDHVTYLIAQG